MHLLLTDRLSCPRCGPTFGLILLADRLDDRVVLDGSLGCPNCRDSFSIVSGFADLRAPPRVEPPEGLVGDPPVRDEEDAERVIALLGVAGGTGTVALVGQPARYAGEMAAASEGIQVVGVDPGLASWPERPRVSRLMASPGLPFFGASLRAVAVDGRLGREWIEEAARAVVPRGRVLVVQAAGDSEEVLRRSGMEVLAAEAQTVVATRD